MSLHRTLRRPTGTRIAGPIAVVAAALGLGTPLSGARSDPTYDLLLAGGRVIDPKNGVDGVRDVAFAAGRVAAVRPHVDPNSALRSVDCTGLLVTPGLVDIHVHVYAGTGARGAFCGDSSVYPDGFTLRTGVTTVVDAGSSGAANFEDFQDRVVARSRTRVLAWLNIVNAGMAGAAEQDASQLDATAAAAMVEKHEDVIVGVKTAHWSGPEWIAVDRALEAGKAARVPVMVDFGSFRPERPFEELVTERLRAGDVYTHAYSPSVPFFDSEGRLRDYLVRARERGVVFDVGHGGASFLFRQAAPAVRQGFLPDSISTDLHVGSMNAGMRDLNDVMSKFLNLGLSEADVIRRVTWNPAREIRREELGNLAEGAIGDAAVLAIEPGEFGFVDCYGARLRGRKRFVCELTIKDGAVVFDANGRSRDDWDRLGDYGPQGDPRWDGVRGPTAPRKH